MLKERFDGYLHDRLARPQPDLLTELLNSKYRDGTSPDFEMYSLLARFLFGAGQDTTARLMTIAIRILESWIVGNSDEMKVEADDPAVGAEV